MMHGRRTTEFLGVLFLAILTVGYAPAGEGMPPRKIIPLDWKWKPAEIKDMKRDLKSVKANEDKTYDFDGESWIVKTYHTPAFTIQVSKYMEAFSEVFNQVFLFQKEPILKDVKPTMIVFRSQFEYEKNGGVPGSGGVFSPRVSMNGDQTLVELELSAFYSTTSKEPSFDASAPLDTIQHEATHCLLQQIFGTNWVPAWLTEGAATYYESWNLRLKLDDDDGSKKNIEARNDRRKHSAQVQYMRTRAKEDKKNELPSLQYLTSLGVTVEWNIDKMGEETGYHYCLAESFTDYLMNSKKRRPFLVKIMERLYANEDILVTPEELAEHEFGWLEFLDKYWGVKFNSALYAKRMKELAQMQGEKADKDLIEKNFKPARNPNKLQNKGA